MKKAKQVQEKELMETNKWKQGSKDLSKKDLEESKRVNRL